MTVNDRKISGMCTCNQKRDTYEMSHAICEPVNDDVNPCGAGCVVDCGGAMKFFSTSSS